MIPGLEPAWLLRVNTVPPGEVSVTSRSDGKPWVIPTDTTTPLTCACAGTVMVDVIPAALLSGKVDFAPVIDATTAASLANNPALLVADEPTGQLDAETGHAVMELLRAVVRSENVTALVATHDATLLDLADRVLELSDGEIVQH